MTEQRARIKIYEALVLNREIKKAIRKRILEQTMRSVMIISRFV